MSFNYSLNKKYQLSAMKNIGISPEKPCP